MTIKEKLINELEQTPELIIKEVLDFLQFLKSKQNKETRVSSARSVLKELVIIGQRQTLCDVVQVCRESRDELQERGLSE
ncbi:MAG: hypothetical protein AAGG51_14315 [Cyanobacteria bacterium P01_G01_bin.54]